MIKDFCLFVFKIVNGLGLFSCKKELRKVLKDNKKFDFNYSSNK